MEKAGAARRPRARPPGLRHFPCIPAPDLDPPAAAQALCEQVLAELQAAIAEPEAETKIAFITQGALPVGEGESPDLAAAAACGLVRSAQAEHPGRFTLLDTDAGAASQAAIEAALAIATEPQLALREGQAFASRLAPAPQPEAEPRPFDPNATVLITGGTGTLGALFARHLISAYGVSHLLLASRRGAEAPGAAQLQEELAALGATVEIRACDVADPEQLAALVGSVSPEHPLGAIIHSAGATDDGLIDSLDPERLQGTFAPKATAAWHLHQLSREIEGCELISFSSVAGTLQSPGQGNYAAANAFLDALAQARQGEGLAGCSLGWGGWEAESELTARLGEGDRARITRGGAGMLPAAAGLELFDRTRALPDPRPLAVRLQSAALRSLAREGALAPLLSGLVRLPARRLPASASLPARLATAPAAEHQGIVLALVRKHVAIVLGHASEQAIDPQAAFKDLGFDSLAAVELRNQLGRATGLGLPATLVFDHPSAAAVAEFLLGKVRGSAPAPAPARAGIRSEEPIAIVGMSCLYPGGAGSPEALWELLAAGGDGISAFPDDRGWELGRLLTDPERPDASNAREGGFLHDAAGFDAAFFGISPREALAMDPQQRLLLEAAWEACEDAGVDPVSLAGSDTGVFAGLMHHDYGSGSTNGSSSAQSAAASGSVVSGRLAYSLGLTGPALTVDTACSSSLVATHLACQALRGGECELALAGGVTVMATPGVFVEFSRQRGPRRATAAASPSTPTPTAPASARASACWSSSASPTPSATATPRSP